MKEKCVHDFHFVMDRRIKERLKGLDFFWECKGVSGVIVKILRMMAPVVKREHKWGEQRMGRYRPVCDDADEVREDVHVYMPPGMYRELKLLHQDLNVYSIAQLVREFVEWFLVFAENCVGDVFRELEKLFAAWLEEDMQTRLTMRGYLRQLQILIRHLPGKNRLVTIYSGDFSPFRILRI